MLDRFYKFFSRLVASAERDRLLLKFEQLETRMDKLEIAQVETKSEIKAIHEIWLANSELLEGKLNLSKVNQEVIKDMIDMKFSLMGQSFEGLRELIKNPK